MTDEKTTTTSEKRAASVLLNGLAVLEAFTIEEPVLGVTEIARRVGFHKSTVSRILATLEQAGYVEREAQGGRFRLGLGLIALTGPLLADLDVRRVAASSLQQLAGRTEETSALMVWNGHESVVVEQVMSPKQVKHTAAIGTRYNTYESASVQIFLADLPAADVDRLLERRLIVSSHGDAEPIDHAIDFAAIREQGYAVNDGRTSAEEVGIAAPVRDHRGDTVAAVLLSAPRFRVPPTLIEILARDVVACAAEVSARLGNTGE